MEQENQQIPLKPARLGKAIRRGFGDVYDRIGLVVVASFIWFLSLMIPITIGSELARHGSKAFFAIGAIVALLLAMPVTAGIYVLANRIVNREDPSLSDIKAGFGEILWPSIKLGVIDIIVTVILATDIAFMFGKIGPKGGIHSPVLVILGIIFLYIMLAWVVSMMYHLPVLVWQKPPVYTVIKRGFLLSADNPFFTIGLLFAIILLTILCAIPLFFGMAVLFIGAAAILTTNALRELFIKYGMVEESAEDDSGWPSGK